MEHPRQLPVDWSQAVDTLRPEKLLELKGFSAWPRVQLNATCASLNFSTLPSFSEPRFTHRDVQRASNNESGSEQRLQRGQFGKEQHADCGGK